MYVLHEGWRGCTWRARVSSVKVLITRLLFFSTAFTVRCRGRMNECSLGNSRGQLGWLPTQLWGIAWDVSRKQHSGLTVLGRKAENQYRVWNWKQPQASEHRVLLLPLPEEENTFMCGREILSKPCKAVVMERCCWSFRSYWYFVLCDVCLKSLLVCLNSRAVWGQGKMEVRDEQGWLHRCGLPWLAVPGSQPGELSQRLPAASSPHPPFG